MVAYNFSERFAGPVERREKKQTIRRQPRAEVGDKIQLYTGQRTKDCRKLSDVDPICTRTAKVEIDEAGLRYNGHYQTPAIADTYARLDGFKDFDEMREWFFDRYGYETFVGHETRWEWE